MRTLTLGLLSLLLAVPAFAQFQMPDPRQMSGIPRPVDDLPVGSVSVRLIRGSLSNNITGHPVELHMTNIAGASTTQTVKTDDAGRAQFDKLPQGARLQATADVDGEHLESQEFPAPVQGGIRLLLVATDTSKGPATEPNAPAVTGQVVLGNQTHIVLEPSDEALNVYYLLDISNTARMPVNPATPFIITLPKEALGAGIMDGSSPQAVLAEGRVIVKPPFAPGETFVQVGFELPASSGDVELNQVFPVAFESLAVVAKKAAAPGAASTMTLSSPLLTAQREMPANGEVFIAATGGPVSAGQPVTLTVDGLPHHSSAPRTIALALASLIVILAIATGGSPPKTDQSAQAAERKRLITRRERLLNDLVKLEADRRTARVDEARYSARRAELVDSLERVYGALDSDSTNPDPARGAGLAA